MNSFFILSWSNVRKSINLLKLQLEGTALRIGTGSKTASRGDFLTGLLNYCENSVKDSNHLKTSSQYQLRSVSATIVGIAERLP